MRHVMGGSGRQYAVEDTELNSGGQAKLYRCRDDKGLVRVYKEYLKPLHDSADIAQLSRLQRMGHDIVARAEAQRSLAGTASSSVNWPIDLVRSGHDVKGVVLPLIPDEFMRDGKSPRTLDFLSLARANPPEASVRVGVLIRVCDIFAYLESEQLVHGDVSAKNVVWRPSPSHAYLIDSDGMRSFSPAPTNGVCTPGWEDPRLQAGKIKAHDRYSDRYALALAMYKGLFLNPGAPCYVNGTWTGASGFPRKLDPRLRDLFTRALGKPLATDGRPTAAQWRQTLTSVFLDGTGNFRRPPLDVLDAYAKQYRDAHTQQFRAGAARRGTATPTPAPVVAAPPAARRPVPAPQTPARQLIAARAQAALVPATPVRATPVRTASNSSSPFWAIMLILVLAAGGGVAYKALNEQQQEQGDLRSDTATRPCPTEIAADIPDGADAVLLHHYVTDWHDITLCRTTGDTVYYHGALLNSPDADTITIPATETSTGYRAPKGDYLYEIDGAQVLVTLPSGKTKSYRLTEVIDPG
ncbi:hypothetical protein OHA61_07650 [Streptomyces sp. NBC_00885]|uniref:hypothetical protein n=1 Tax=Streptomyces sp. NBC_00885 TaxID=2975857 RepID=UPI00386CCBD8|nr:hypothetical protein OHA61_07650 [Streptomyces sp. NBC_00885]